MSPGAGTLTRGCTVNGATFLILNTVQGHQFRFVHMKADTVPIDYGQSLYVNTGEILGQVTGAGDFESSSCKMSSDGPHIHFSWLRKDCGNISFQGFVFDCSGVVSCPGIGVYNTSCNRKYLNTRFISTNKPHFWGCKGRINNATISGDYNTNLELQKCLISLGVLGSQYQTGYYGTLTARGVKTAKRFVNLPARCANAIYNEYVYGETSYEVFLLQNCMIYLGLMPEGYNTKFYGPMTQAAVKEAKEVLVTIRQSPI